jgi:uncharacterized protein YjbJ (UPF0337 family)
MTTAINRLFSFITKETPMSKDRIEGHGKQVKQQWGRLTDDHPDTIDGRRDRRHGQIRKSYGIAMNDAGKQVQAGEKCSEHPFDEASRHIIRNAALQISR